MAVKTQAIRAIDPFRIEDPGTHSSIQRVRFVPNQELNRPEQFAGRFGKDGFRQAK